MTLVSVDSLWAQIKKYMAVGLIAGTLGFYNGCQHGIGIGERRCARIHAAYGEMMTGNHGMHEGMTGYDGMRHGLHDRTVDDAYRKKGIEALLEDGADGYHR